MWKEALSHVVMLPRAKQFEALQKLRDTESCKISEEWNTDFGHSSLYEAWAQTPLMRGLYESNRSVLRHFLDTRISTWRIVEVGGGNGALWHGFFRPKERGELVLIDHVPEVHNVVADCLPSNIRLQSIVAPIEEADVPEADSIVCSLTLHHVAGIDMEQRRKFGMAGPGKFEILKRFVDAILPRDGIGILNEADIYTEIDLPPGEPVLVDRIIDSYVRRCARAIAEAMGQPSIDESLKLRWEAIIIHWCIDQVEKAGVPREERDVYELDIPRWLDLLERAGAYVNQHRFTDEWNLFHQYLFTASEGP